MADLIARIIAGAFEIAIIICLYQAYKRQIYICKSLDEIKKAIAKDKSID